MPKNTSMSSRNDILITKPNNRFTKIFDIFACTGNH